MINETCCSSCKRKLFSSRWTPFKQPCTFHTMSKQHLLSQWMEVKMKNECQTLQNTISAFLSFYVCCSNIYTSKERLVLGLRYNLSCCGMTNISSIVSSILPNIQLSLSESHCLALKALYFQHRLPKKDITKTVI